MRVKVITISAKVTSLDLEAFDDANRGTQVGKTYEGDIPDWLFGDDSGYRMLSLDVDVETGKILNWNKPSEYDLEETFYDVDWENEKA